MSTGNGGWDFSNFTPPRQEPGSGGPYGAYGDPNGGGQASPFGAPPQGQAAPYGAPAGAPPQPFGGAPGGQPGGGQPGGPFAPSGYQQQPGAVDPFGTSQRSETSTAPLEAVKAPTGWLLVALVVALLSGVAASIFGSIPAVAIASWALAGPAVIGLLAVYLRKDVQARAHLTYSPPLWAPLLYAIVLVLAFIAVMIASLQIAFWVGRM